jgi:hypothetical protein
MVFARRQRLPLRESHGATDSILPPKDSTIDKTFDNACRACRETGELEEIPLPTGSCADTQMVPSGVTVACE